VAALEAAAEEADNLLCMSVNPGWGGQRFIPAALGRVGRPAGAGASRLGRRDRRRHRARDDRRRILGGRQPLTAGSAIYSAPEPGAAYQALVEQVRAVGPPAWA
jgi:ribulose-phosphate 3-epimerase